MIWSQDLFLSTQNDSETMPTFQRAEGAFSRVSSSSSGNSSRHWSQFIMIIILEEGQFTYGPDPVSEPSLARDLSIVEFCYSHRGQIHFLSEVYWPPFQMMMLGQRPSPREQSR